MNIKSVEQVASNLSINPMYYLSGPGRQARGDHTSRVSPVWNVSLESGRPFAGNYRLALRKVHDIKTVTRSLDAGAFIRQGSEHRYSYLEYQARFSSTTHQKSSYRDRRENSQFREQSPMRQRIQITSAVVVKATAHDPKADSRKQLCTDLIIKKAVVCNRSHIRLRTGTVGRIISSEHHMDSTRKHSTVEKFSTGPHRQGHDMTISSLQSGHWTTRWIEGQGSRRLAVTERSPVVIVADNKEKQGPEGSASYSHCITAQLDSHLWGTPTLWQITGSSNSPANWRQHGRAL
ncbi:hypothetical protein RRG08_019164 [Elysia crispata]|uniref:Uncharacterized protein n=1 Tax=Elysia crispata TaxID=231223 RepID=A0AAE1CWV9_9GAST|nr:hypothetical protein RRG08_019164 [Elysia crispata]